MKIYCRFKDTGTMGVSSALTNILENRWRKFYLYQLSMLFIIYYIEIEKESFYLNQYVFYSF